MSLVTAHIAKSRGQFAVLILLDLPAASGIADCSLHLKNTLLDPRNLLSWFSYLAGHSLSVSFAGSFSSPDVGMSLG